MCENAWAVYWSVHGFAMSVLILAFSVAATIPINAASSGWTKEFVRITQELGTYGKTSLPGSLSLKLPKTYFTHFYVVGVSVNLALLLTSTEKSTIWLLSLYQVHVARRLYESLWVSRSSSSAKIHLAHYVLGVSYYVSTPLTLVCVSDGDHIEGGALSWLFGFLFLFANWVQHECHCFLANLRPPSSKNTHEAYYIPRGRWFKMVSCPHYASEIVIYVCLAALSRGSLPLLIQVTFVMFELGFASWTQHQWYLRQFDDYPKERYAMLPGIF